MQLIIDDFGVFLGKKGSRFVVKNGEEKKKFSAENVNQIIISSASSVSTDAISCREDSWLMCCASGKPCTCQTSGKRCREDS